ncbi:MAG: type II toxin-antitoxin system HicB family antitoxin [Oscillospiraceae bacterium]|jgi:predicted RNase H-like HicB family nuclease|nr:type II toxin-antitoxin system HicB family antitoxin [Oscillospiraceae bacterium]
MRKVSYLAVFEPNGNGGFGVYFPDLPGCASYGDTFERATREAEDALGLHLYALEKDGEVVPRPSAAPEIDPETESGYLVSCVTVYPDLIKNELDNKRVKTNTTIPAWLKEAAEERQVNFSRLLETALLDYLGVAVSR